MAEAQRSGMHAEPRGAVQGLSTASLPSGSRVWGREGRGGRQALTDYSGAGHSKPLRRCERITHAVSSAKSYGTPALDDGHLSWVLGT